MKLKILFSIWAMLAIFNQPIVMAETTDETMESEEAPPLKLTKKSIKKALNDEKDAAKKEALKQTYIKAICKKYLAEIQDLSDSKDKKKARNKYANLMFQTGLEKERKSARKTLENALEKMKSDERAERRKQKEEDEE